MSFSLDIAILIAAAILLLISILTPFINPFFRFRKLAKSEVENPVADTPPVSLLITVSNKQAQELAVHLPQWLAQDYAPGYEVIVVAEKGDSDAEDVVLQNMSGHENLYATYLPQSSRYMSRQKLAVTLGVKAAKNEWIILTDASCMPASDKWLATMSQGCIQSFSDSAEDGNNLILGYENYEDSTRPYYRFERLHTSCYLLRKAARKTAYRANSCTLAFRKSDFISQDGYRGNLEFIRGERDFLVNKYAQPHRTAVILDPDAWTIEDKPLRKEWQSSHIFYMHTRKHLRRSASMRWLFNTDQWTLHLTFLLQLCTIAASIALLVGGKDIVTPAYPVYVLLATGIFSLLLTALIRSFIAKPVVKRFEPSLSLWCIYPYELSTVWHQLAHLFRYKRASLLDFTTHKL